MICGICSPQLPYTLQLHLLLDSAEAFAIQAKVCRIGNRDHFRVLAAVLAVSDARVVVRGALEGAAMTSVLHAVVDVQSHDDFWPSYVLTKTEILTNSARAFSVSIDSVPDL